MQKRVHSLNKKKKIGYGGRLKCAGGREATRAVRSLRGGAAERRAGIESKGGWAQCARGGKIEGRVTWRVGVDSSVEMRKRPRRPLLKISLYLEETNCDPFVFLFLFSFFN